MGGRGVRGVLLGGVLASLAASPRVAWADEPSSIRFGLGAGLGVGFYQFSDAGPWLEARGVANVSLGSSLYLNGELALAYTRNSADKTLDYDADGVDDLNTDDHTLLALFPRATLGLRLSPAFALEVGGFFGIARTTLESTQCGRSEQTGAGYGFGAGPALSLGERRQIAIALHGEFLWVPYERCTNGSSDSFEAGTSFTPHLHLQDDAQLGVLVRAHYLF